MKRLAICDRWWQNRPTTSDALKAHWGGPAAEDMIGIELHKRESQVSMLTEEDEGDERRLSRRGSVSRYCWVVGTRARILLARWARLAVSSPSP